MPPDWKKPWLFLSRDSAWLRPQTEVAGLSWGSSRSAADRIHLGRRGAAGEPDPLSACDRWRSVRCCRPMPPQLTLTSTCQISLFYVLWRLLYQTVVSLSLSLVVGPVVLIVFIITFFIALIANLMCWSCVRARYHKPSIVLIYLCFMENNSHHNRHQMPS